MTKHKFFFPSQNIIGSDCLGDVAEFIKEKNYKKILIVTDQVLLKIGTIAKLEKILNYSKIQFTRYDNVLPNPTINNVNEGYEILKSNNCDCVISVGGGSPHDCGKLIALLGGNGGQVEDYVGIDKSKKSALPIIAINTTAGTAAEMTKGAVVTDTNRNLKRVIADKHMTASLSVNDIDLMISMPPNVTAATGMDALTHAIESYVSKSATPLTEGCSIKAIELISKNLKLAFDDGNNLEARRNMAYAQFIAGMAFNNARLGYVHCMAHQLGGFYNLPHGVCNAILLPHVEEYNAKNSSICARKLKDVAIALGFEEARTMNDKDGSLACIKKIRELSKAVSIPKGLAELGVKKEDFSSMADYALIDNSSPHNPVQGTKEDIIKLFEIAM